MTSLTPLNKTSVLPDVDSLSLPEQVAQLFVVRASGHLFDHQIRYPQWEAPAAKLLKWIENLGVGGVIFVGGSAGDLYLRTQQLQAQAKIPLLMAADIEEGVGQRFEGATWFPPPMAIGAIAKTNINKARVYAEKMGKITAQEALAIGINWILAPVVDVNNNPNNPVINVRAFGENSQTVSDLTAAFIQGAKKYAVLTTAKHFPGHGDTAVDSHLDLPVLPHSAGRLQEIELPSFQRAIAQGVDGVMSAHLLIPAWDAEKPATLSHKILTGQLREKLGFTGLIVTDALVMGAIANRYGPNEAPILALEAGADILLMPVDPEGAIQAVCDAVKTGRISAARIRESVVRIFTAKQKIFAASEKLSEFQPSSAIPAASPCLSQLSQPEARDTVEQILGDSTLVYGSVPLKIPPPQAGSYYRNLILVDQAVKCDFLALHTPAVAWLQKFGYKTIVCDVDNAENFLTATRNLEIKDDREVPTLVQLFVRGNPFASNAGLTKISQEWIKKLLKKDLMQALAIYGSPYTLEQFLPQLPPDMPCIFSYGQLPEAQAIALKLLFDLFD